MFRHIKFASLAFLFMAVFSTFAIAAQQDTSVQPASSKFVPPKLIQLSYEVTKNGQPFARVHEQFIVTGNTYKLESVTKGIGVYALFGERKLISKGELTSQGLKPNHFELHQGDNPQKALFADFDWPNKILHMMVKGNLKDANLIPGAQDLASYAYQFMFLPAPLKDAVTMTLTTGKKLNQYQYKITAEQELLAIEGTSGTGTQYKTLHLVQQEQNKPQTETKELWLATEHYYLPVRILMIDENGAKIEQTLTELHVE
ncbi:MAG: DUF3108 domain-containing protein [Methylotenera sp.]